MNGKKRLRKRKKIRKITSISMAMASTSTSQDKKPTRNWADLPSDVTANILHRIGPIEILENAQKVCTEWRKVCKDPSMWRVVDMHSPGGRRRSDLVKMCEHAVDRSQGQLVDIIIGSFATRDLLLYIADRASQLRRLQLVHCKESLVSEDVLSKLPLLEELHLYIDWVTGATIDCETIGRCCPLLKSFKFDGKICTRTCSECDDEAISIAKNMPGLHHLSLVGKSMTDAGLQAILDKCLHLESLDLRHCKFVSLGGDVWKRCLGQVKDVRHPGDSTDDHMFGTLIRYKRSKSFVGRYHTIRTYCFPSGSDSSESSDIEDYGIYRRYHGFFSSHSRYR